VNLTFPHFQTAGLQPSTSLRCSSSKSDREAKIYAVLVGINNTAGLILKFKRCTPGFWRNH